MATTLKAFIQTAQGYLNEGASAETSLMFLLKELESLAPLWSKQHTTWGALLQDHQLCSPARYSRFKVAAKEFRKPQFEKIGVSACILVAHVPKRDRQKVKEAVVAWSKAHGPVTPQRVGVITQQVAPRAVSSARRYVQDVKVWRRHAHKLEAMLLEHGIRPPSLKEAATEDTALDTSVAFIRAKFKLKTVYPSCSDADLLRIATEQVETASGNLKTALQQSKSKSGAYGLSTREFPDKMLDKIIREHLPSGKSLVSADEIVKALRELDKSGMLKHKNVMSNRVLLRMRACSKLEDLGKVGNRSVFRKRK